MSEPNVEALQGLPGFALEETARVFVLPKRAPRPGDESLDLQELVVDEVTYIPVFTSASRIAQAFGEDAAVEAIEIELGLLRDMMRGHDGAILGLIDPGAAHMAVFDPKG